MKPIILTADLDRCHGLREIIPAGTVGLPVVFGAPGSREGQTANNYLFPALRGTPPWDGMAPIYDIDIIHRDATFERLEPDDPRVLEARRLAKEHLAHEDARARRATEGGVSAVLSRVRSACSELTTLLAETDPLDLVRAVAHQQRALDIIRLGCKIYPLEWEDAPSGHARLHVYRIPDPEARREFLLAIQDARTLLDQHLGITFAPLFHDGEPPP